MLLYQGVIDLIEWLNSEPLAPKDLVGRNHAFQMLCPGCVSHGLPPDILAEFLWAVDHQPFNEES